MRTLAAVASFALAATVVAGPASTSLAQTSGLQKINHIVVIYQENWSFDSLYGKFPGANGLDQAAATTPQVDKSGIPSPSLPQPLNTTFNPAVPDPRFPSDMPVAPFETSRFVGASSVASAMIGPTTCKTERGVSIFPTSPGV